MDDLDRMVAYFDFPAEHHKLGGLLFAGYDSEVNKVGSARTIDATG